MKTVHLIFNAHLDPIWLWPWQAGLDEALATCRSACDRLDAHPDLRFSRGEAWVYAQVERLDPALFARIQAHVAAGRWEIVGGWWIQPDCNAPSGWGMERQIALSRTYFEERFGQFPRVAYNVDSFGHAATLPALMRAQGQNRYVMMRPQEHEKALPARLFRWRGYDDGPEVVTFRIASGYQNVHITLDHVRASLTELPDGVDHTMCFVGVGDHGGGPTERQIAWCREHEYALADTRLVFSTPARFFEAVTPQVAALPLVTGELQQHAVGCYSTYRAVKTGVRRAEHALRQAEVMVGEITPALDAAWKTTCFHQFHDTLGGTCLPSAYVQVRDQLGGAVAAADEALQYGLRRKLSALPDAPLQRFVLFNASDTPFEGHTEFEPWVDWWNPWGADCQLLDENNRPLPVQACESEALCEFRPGGRPARLLLPVRLAPGAMQVVQIERGVTPAPTPSAITVCPGESLVNDVGAGCGANGPFFDGLPAFPAPRLELIADDTDTWAHGIDRFGGSLPLAALWEPPTLLDRGPLMGALRQMGTLGESRLWAEWRVYAAEPFVELRLGIHWLEAHKVLKLTLPLAGAEARTDGILGGQLARANDGRELPLRDWTLLPLRDGLQLGVVCPDVFALDATPERLRLTLLRAVPMAYHVPYAGPMPRAVMSDQGAHEFRFRFFFGPSVQAETLDHQGLMLQRPLVTADLTRGMPPDARMPGGSH